MSEDYEKAEQIFEIPISEIFLDSDFNCRDFINPLECDSMAQDIGKNGQLQAIMIRPFSDPKKPEYKFKAVLGHRRLTAIRDLLKWKTIKAVVNHNIKSDLEAFTMNVQENMQRKDLNLQEEGKVVGRYLVQGLTRDQIAEEVSMSTGWVQVRTMMFYLPPDVQREIVTHKIGTTEVRRIHSIFNDCLPGHYDKLYKYVLAVKEGKKNPDSVLKPKKPKRKNDKRVRSKSEMQEFMDHIRENGRGACIGTRILAWAAGNIDNGELDKDLAEWHEEEGFAYTSLFDDGSDNY